jgi:hypothetical protein
VDGLVQVLFPKPSRTADKDMSNRVPDHHLINIIRSIDSALSNLRYHRNEIREHLQVARWALSCSEGEFDEMVGDLYDTDVWQFIEGDSAEDEDRAP